MSKLARRLLKAFAITLGGFAVLIVAVVVVLHLDVTREWGRGFAIEQVEAALEADLQIGSLEGSVFDTLVARDVAFLTRKGTPIARVDRLEVETALIPLFVGEVAATVRGDGVDVYLLRTRDGELDLLNIVPQDDDSPVEPIPVEVNLAIDLTDVAIVYRDEGASSEGDPLAGIGPAIDHDEIDEAAGNVTTPAQIRRSAPHTIIVDDATLSGRLVVQHDVVTRIGVEKLSGSVLAHGITARRAIEVSGFALRAEPDGDVGLSATLDVHDWVRAANFTATFPTDIGQMRAAVDELKLTRDAVDRLVPEAKFRTGLSARVAIAPSEDRGSIFHAVLSPEGADREIEVAGHVDGWVEPGPQMDWRVDFAGPQMRPSDVAAAASPLQRLSAWLTASGTGVDPDEMVASATVAVRSAQIGSYRVEAVSGRVVADAGTLRVPQALVVTPYASAAASARWSPEGDLSVRARARSTDATSQVAKKLFGRDLDTRADLDVKAKGRLDLERDDPIAMLQNFDASVRWNIQRFVAEDVRIDSSRGKLIARVEPVGDQRRRVHYDVDARARSVRMTGLDLDALSVDSRGSSVVTAPKIDTMSVLKNLSARANLKVAGLKSDGTSVSDVDLMAEVKPWKGKTKYRVRGSVARASFDGARVADAAADLSGTLGLGRQLSWPQAVKTLSADGDVAARELTLAGDSVGTLDASVDVAGPLSDIRGEVLASTTKLSLGAYEFDSLDAKVGFVGDRYFVIDASGRPQERPAEVVVHLKGRYSRDLTEYQIETFRFQTADEAWRMSDGFSLDTRSGTFRFDDVVVEHGSQTVRVDGHFRQGEGQELDIDVDDVDLATVAREFEIDPLVPVRAMVDAKATVGGTATEPTATFTVTLTDVYWQEWGPFTIFLEGRYGELELVVERFEVDGYDVRLAQGNAVLPIRIETKPEFEVLQERPVDVFVETPKFRVSSLHGVVQPLADYGVEGKVGMETRLKGTLLDPVFSADVRTEGLTSTGGVEGGGADLGPVDSTLSVRYLNPDRPAGGLEAAVHAAWGEEPPIQALTRVQADAAQWLRDYLDGDEIDWTQRLRGAPWRLMARAQKFDLRNIRLGPLRTADAEGFVTLEVSADGTLADPSAELDLDLDGFGWERYRDVFVDAEATLDKRRFQLEKATLEWDADPILEARGSFPTPFQVIFGDSKLGELPLDATVELLPLPAAKFSAIDYSFAAIKGTVRGYAKMEGTLTEPEMTSRLLFDNFEFSDKSRGTVAVEISADPVGKVAGDLVICTGPTPILAGSLSAPVDLNLLSIARGEEIQVAGEVRASLKGNDVRLARLLPRKIFDDYVSQLDGRMDVDLELSGTVEEPRLSGRMQVADGAVFLGQFSRGIKNISFDLSANGDTLKLHQARLEDERGYLTAQGSLGFDGFLPRQVDAEAKLKDIGTTGFIEYTMFVSADVELEGDLGAGSGTAPQATAKVSQLEVVMPDQSDQTALPTTLDPTIVVVRGDRDREGAFEWEFEQTRPAGKSYMQLTVQVERNSWIRHPLAQVEVMADIDVEFSTTGVVLDGEAETVRGRAEVVGKQFEIEQGIVTFTGQNPPNPKLQLEAVHGLKRKVTEHVGPPSRGEPRAIVRVTGRLNEPRIRFLSDPEMPESDVMYTLVTGRAPGGSDVGQDQASGIAAGAASGIASGLIEKQLGQVLPFSFDVVRLEAGDEGFADPTLEVGKYVTTDVYLSIETKFGAEANENLSELNIEYRFLPRWILEFEAGNLGTGEANVFWEIY